MKTLEKRMIKWKLREVMARGRITNRELAQHINHHETSVSRMKMSDTMPRIDGATLNSLCNGLSKLFQAKGHNAIITPSDLIEYAFDDDKDRQVNLIEQPDNSCKTDRI